MTTSYCLCEHLKMDVSGMSGRRLGYCNRQYCSTHSALPLYCYMRPHVLITQSSLMTSATIIPLRHAHSNQSNLNEMVKHSLHTCSLHILSVYVNDHCRNVQSRSLPIELFNTQIDNETCKYNKMYFIKAKGTRISTYITNTNVF
jgi:hypothetical protein